MSFEQARICSLTGPREGARVRKQRQHLAAFGALVADHPLSFFSRNKDVVAMLSRLTTVLHPPFVQHRSPPGFGFGHNDRLLNINTTMHP